MTYLSAASRDLILRHADVFDPDPDYPPLPAAPGPAPVGAQAPLCRIPRQMTADCRDGARHSGAADTDPCFC
ncbi:hypothetical protein [Streptacidiphilus sp. EB129]|uniref:hypothetical protein n=1 Tax=Streptacidiphilus sp. EB129 TaxID=3156262 RepID=UPI0035152259